MKKLFPDSTIYKSKLWDVHQDWEVPIPAFFIMAPVRSGVRTFSDLTEQESVEFMQVLRKIRKGTQDVLGIDDVYFFQNEDTAHGFHFWIFPRHEWMKEFGTKIQSVRPIMEHAKQNMLDEDTHNLVLESAEKMKKYININNNLRAGIFIDASNTYFSERRAGWKIDYGKLREMVESEFELVIMKYYVAIPDKDKDTNMYNAKIKYLNKIKDVVDIVKKPIKYISESVKIDNKHINRLIRKGDIDVDLSVDVLDVCDGLDIIIVLSGDSDYVALRDDLLKKNKKVLFIAHRPNLSHEIKQGKYVTLKSIRKFIELGASKAKQTPAHGGRTLVNILYKNSDNKSSKN